LSHHDDSRTRSQQRFGHYAQRYVESQVHASGDDLERLLAMAQPRPGWLALDIATGGGHTALRFAPRVGYVIAADLTPRMLQAARRFITGKADNVSFVTTDAQDLAFSAGVFDLVTCRIAPHHFPDCFRFVQECARVLKPGGQLLVQDHVLPEDDDAGRYIDAFERLRDPSHHRAYAEYEWRGMFLDAGLQVEQVEIMSRSAGGLIPWAQRQDCAQEIIEKLQILLAQAPQAAAAFMHPRCAGSADADFDHTYILIQGRKE
jgi:ubiquinone/menaquinone biosynthesis C-methylase UbiE